MTRLRLPLHTAQYVHIKDGLAGNESQLYISHVGKA